MNQLHPRRELAKRLDSRKKEVGAAAHGGERGQASDRFADRPLRDLEFERAVLSADDRVTLVAEFVKVPVVHPYVLRELELPDEAGADHERRDAALLAVIRRALRQRRTIGRAAADHAATVHVGCRVARVHAAHVRAERHGITLRIRLLVVEIVVALQIGAQALDRPCRAPVPVERRCASAPSASQR